MMSEAGSVHPRAIVAVVLCGESRYKSERQREKLSAAQFCGTAPTSLRE
jgi:hypothetical protein